MSTPGSVKLGEELRIEGRVTEWSGIRCWVEFDVLRAADSVLLVACRQALALVDVSTGKPVRLPAGFPASLSLGR